MSGVGLRCPACGTTQSHPGECDACLEGNVRYFCSNHSPGLWLDEAVCKACGAEFGATPRRLPEPAPRATPTVPARERRRPGSRPTMPPGVPSPAGLRRPAPRVADPDVSPATPSLLELLAHISQKWGRTLDEVDKVPRRAPTADTPRRSIPVMGCLVRLVLVVLVLIGLALGGLLLLIGGGI